MIERPRTQQVRKLGDFSLGSGSTYDDASVISIGRVLTGQARDRELGEMVQQQKQQVGKLCDFCLENGRDCYYEAKVLSTSRALMG